MSKNILPVAMLAVVAVAVWLAANLFFKIGPPPPPSGSVGLALLSAISDLVFKAGGTVKVHDCGMIAKQEISVTCKNLEIRQADLTMSAEVGGWKFERKTSSAAYKSALIFSQNKDSLVLEVDQGGWFA
ncbi:hypothetical protein LJR175_000716 [Variovorax sp. LjRoot175]|uniref:hypothetical protein n=1 Tax=Variovorax sp. LjRoot175 TaxID=3342276 RepID=UPI003ECEB630